MIELYFIFNGHHRYHLGNFVQVQDAIDALKAHQKSSSAINNPRFRKSMSGNTIRIDYGAVDCYYLITVSKEKEKE
ncbi:hypothetical protein PCO09_00520 [Streptococcus suis]|uniref:hypothetical protein n=1 Tax=Streptococcus suis TaxID=1307 RepID=UPI0025B23DE2|nr:hypothetical protein [Streptococcus suis]MDN2966440.1 hypothetical protein [Streptococcus suis]MDN2983706.1 hypothetical protein [Streptococcus suis]MDN2985620.1 hypothetical protein [Streptococcus suis]